MTGRLRQARERLALTPAERRARRERYKTARYLEQPLTQEEFADRLGVAAKTVKTWEKDDAVPAPNAPRVAAELGIPVDQVERQTTTRADAGLRKLVREELVAVLHEVQFPRLEQLGAEVERLLAATNKRLDELEAQLRPPHRRRAGGADQ